MSVPSFIRDWLTSPLEWGEFGTKANWWFNELVDFVNGFNTETVTLATNVIAFGGAYGSAAYANKGPGGLVSVDGLIQNNTGGPLAAGSTWATLPAGYRPGIDQLFAAPASGGAASAIRIDVTTAGAIIVQETLANGSFVSLSGIQFYAAN